jgi:hypothetical protein
LFRAHMFLLCANGASPRRAVFFGSDVLDGH